MKFNLKKYRQLPFGNLADSGIVTQTEWKILFPEEIEKAIDRVAMTFKNYSLNRDAIDGMLAYTCFLNLDQKHLIHFIQWKDESSIFHFHENDPEERVRELFSHLRVERLEKSEYLPFKTFNGSNILENTKLIVFTKQYFNTPEAAKEWTEMILKILKVDNHANRPIQSTFYISDDSRNLLNYALWESEEKYEEFRLHAESTNSHLWSEIKNLKGWEKEKTEIKKHQQFIRIY